MNIHPNNSPNPTSPRMITADKNDIGNSEYDIGSKMTPKNTA